MQTFELKQNLDKFIVSEDWGHLEFFFIGNCCKNQYQRLNYYKLSINTIIYKLYEL